MTPKTCRIPAVHKRLEAAHRAWHAAKEDYNDPDNFTYGLNSAIQELRNVTFALQSALRGKIDGFDDWYKPWMEALKGDPVCKWASDARTTITKIGDLDSLSTLTVWHLFTYDDVTAFRDLKLNKHNRNKYSLEPILSNSEISAMDSGSSYAMPQVQAYGVERRWVVDELPEWDLLDALSHCYTFLAKLILDCEQKLILPSHGLSLQDYPEELLSETHSPDCMRPKETDRLDVVSPRTGHTSTAHTKRIEVDPDMGPELEKRYGPLKPLTKKATSPLDLVDQLLAHAKRVLVADGSHMRFYQLFRGGSPVHGEVVELRDRTDKYLHSLRLAELATTYHADGFLEIAEGWVGSVAEAENYPEVEIEHQPNRKESLSVTAFTQTEGPLTKWVTFRRTAFGIVFSEEQTDHVAWNYLKPLAQAWGYRIDDPSKIHK